MVRVMLVGVWIIWEYFMQTMDIEAQLDAIRVIWTVSIGLMAFSLSIEIGNRAYFQLRDYRDFDCFNYMYEVERTYLTTCIFSH